MPHDYEIGIFIHIIGVFALAGASAISFSTFSMMRRAKTVQEVRVWASLGRIISQYQVFPASALVLILSGGFLVDKLRYEWSDGWIGWSLLAVVCSVAVGLALITPRMKAIGMAAGPAPDGPVPAALTDQLNDPILFGAIHGNLMVTLAILWDMSTRPGGIQAFLAIVLLAAIGAGSAYPMYQRQQKR
jgi:uncharacterized membrane protein